MRLVTRSLVLSFAAIALAGIAPALRAGDLDPPPGPVTPTMKPLSEVEPRVPISALPLVISSPGSYYLTSNLTGVWGQNGITIEASNVTLDLNGFELAGVSGSLSAIAVSEGQLNIAIRNGVIRGWGGAGLDASLAHNCQLELLRSYNNAGDGLYVNQGSTVTACTARANGLSGIIAGNGSSIQNCAARDNGGDGIQAGGGSALVSCAGRDNGDDGVQAGPGSTITACAATSNDDDGINAGIGSTVTASTASENEEDGIQVGDGSTVRACTATLNVGDGIQVPSGCHVVGNTCDSNGAANGAAGIRTTAARNRIDGNNVTGNGVGIAVETEGNLIVRNSARENGANYGIAEGNKVGTITDDPTTAGPWANFEF